MQITTFVLYVTITGQYQLILKIMIIARIPQKIDLDGYKTADDIEKVTIYLTNVKEEIDNIFPYLMAKASEMKYLG